MKSISLSLARAKCRGIRLINTTGVPSDLPPQATHPGDRFDMTRPPALGEKKPDNWVRTTRERWIFWRGYARCMVDFGYIPGRATP